MLNYSMDSPSPFHGCHLKIEDNGAFRCNKGYIKINSINGQQLQIRDVGPCPGFNFDQFIPYDFSAGGIEIGYDISWGMDWPLRQKFMHGKLFQNTRIDLNSLQITISGTTFHPTFNIKDGSGNTIKYSS